MGRPQVILLDTHVAVWMTLDHGLGKQSRRLIDGAVADDELAVSAISFWELAMLIGKRRLRSLDAAADLRRQLFDGGMREISLTGDIAVLAAELEGLSGDPADRIIAATAIIHDAILITADQRLLHWRHPLKRQDAER
jgi:PIN domain nuclease of toxin-antitoxin system